MFWIRWSHKNVGFKKEEKSARNEKIDKEKKKNR